MFVSVIYMAILVRQGDSICGFNIHLSLNMCKKNYVC